MVKFRLAIPPLFATLLLFGALAAACGSDDDTGPGDSSPDATATEPADGGDGGDAGVSGDAGDDGGNGGGSLSEGATLTIGDESWTFDVLFCAFSPKEAQNDNVSFFVSSLSESAEGVLIQLDATIRDAQEEGRYEGEGVIHSLTLDDVEDFENPSIAWSAISGSFGEDDPIIQVDGKSVTAEAVFDDARTGDVIEEVAGRLEATCP